LHCNQNHNLSQPHFAATLVDRCLQASESPAPPLRG
jgi:hypothetical protein